MTKKCKRLIILLCIIPVVCFLIRYFMFLFIPKSFVGIEGLKAVRFSIGINIGLCVLAFLAILGLALSYPIGQIITIYRNKKEKKRKPHLSFAYDVIISASITTFFGSFIIIIFGIGIGLMQFATYVNHFSFIHRDALDDYKLFQSINLDLNSNETEIIIDDSMLLSIHISGPMEKRNAHSHGHNIKMPKYLYTVSAGEDKIRRIFFIGKSDYELFESYENDENNISFELEYYANSGFLKRITPIKYEKRVFENVVIDLTNDKINERTGEPVILINRPEIEDCEGKIFWYVTKDGEFDEVRNAGSKDWTNFLTFAKAGNYTVTLVADYDETTGEYTPISNTIEYTVE